MINISHLKALNIGLRLVAIRIVNNNSDTISHIPQIPYANRRHRVGKEIVSNNSHIISHIPHISYLVIMEVTSALKALKASFMTFTQQWALTDQLADKLAGWGTDNIA